MNNGIPMYYTSNERDYFCLSADIYNPENKHKSENNICKCIFFHFYCSTVHISSNDVPGSLKPCMHVDNIHLE